MYNSTMYSGSYSAFTGHLLARGFVCTSPPSRDMITPASARRLEGPSARADVGAPDVKLVFGWLHKLCGEGVSHQRLS